MTTFTTQDIDAMFGGLAKCLQHIYASLDVVAIRCALELHIPDVINHHDGPITLAQIAHGINSSSLNIEGLSRLMSFLVKRQIIDQVHQPAETDEPLYTLNPCSKWLVQDPKTTTIAPYVMMVTNSSLRSLLGNLSKCIAQGGTTAMNAFGVDFWSFLSVNPRVNDVFNEGMACGTRITMDALKSKYRFDELKGTLVDVGGGLGAAINDIVTAYPHLKGINFDLPQVISTAPTYKGVTHVGGDMFEAIPPADSVFLKSVLHDWSDNKCIQILKNCRDSIPGKTGKIIIVDTILHRGGDDAFEYTRTAHDLMMFSLFENGKERTEVEWKTILNEAGFYRYNVIQIPAIESIIEVYSD
ncbi:xanthohumol 4-O-methyltransferase-like [Cynara cardunculus var. scolymus]|uniref:xanthohumol 4-O-methyltransferase-like n=1 Tax=Cynara cardunculus var. scolymus TaxID=59895 RepID=UPI000D62B05E|nr:xanthohumol 4-O-methyltransferase-like [Cynara cardunculus var. scolymus]